MEPEQEPRVIKSMGIKANRNIGKRDVQIDWWFLLWFGFWFAGVCVDRSLMGVAAGVMLPCLQHGQRVSAS